MIQKLKKIIREIGIMSIGLTLAFIIFIGLSISNAWTNPTQEPPNGNLGAPINTSGTAQIKSGALQVNGFTNIGGMKLTSGAGVGKVLAPSDASGTVAWKPGTAVYKCPKQTYCYINGDINGYAWVSYGCIGQVSASSTCTQNYWNNWNSTLQSCNIACTYLGRI